MSGQQSQQLTLYAFVYFAKVADARRCLIELHGRNYKGRKLNVDAPRKSFKRKRNKKENYEETYEENIRIINQSLIENKVKATTGFSDSGSLGCFDTSIKSDNVPSNSKLEVENKAAGIESVLESESKIVSNNEDDMLQPNDDSSMNNDDTNMNEISCNFSPETKRTDRVKTTIKNSAKIPSISSSSIDHICCYDSDDSIRSSDKKLNEEKDVKNEDVIAPNEQSDSMECVSLQDTSDFEINENGKRVDLSVVSKRKDEANIHSLSQKESYDVGNGIKEQDQSLFYPPIPIVPNSFEKSHPEVHSINEVNLDAPRKYFPANVERCKFRCVGAFQESHRKQIYSVDWSSDLYVSNLSSRDIQNANVDDFIQLAASCGGNYVTIYECRKLNRSSSKQDIDSDSSSTSENDSEEDPDTDTSFQPRPLCVFQTYIDSDKSENFYVCAWGGRGCEVNIEENFEYKEGDPCLKYFPMKTQCYQDSYDIMSRNGPQLLCVAGSRGLIKIIDIRRKMLVLSLAGHGDEIYDMKFSPTNEWLLITASKDESIRLWNLSYPACIAIFAGDKGHRDGVLSCDFHPNGTSFVSSGMDSTIKIWSLESEEISMQLDMSFSASKSRNYTDKLRIVNENIPIYSTSDVHTNYVDCVQYFGHLILSKSIDNVIVLWKPIFGRPKVTNGIKTTIIPLREFRLHRCDLWFIRFHTFQNLENNIALLVCGNNVGDIKVWNLLNDAPSFEKNSFAFLSNIQCKSPARMVKVCPDGHSFIVGCDDGTVWKWSLS